MAKARSIGGIYAELSLRDGKFKAGLKSAKVALGRFAASSAKYAAAGIAAGTAAAAVGLTVGTRRILAMGAELDHLSTQTGFAASSLMTIGQAYKDNGKDASTAAKDIGRMQKAIGDAVNNPDADNPFDEIGMSAQKLINMAPEEQFFAIGAAINGIENPALKAAAAMGIFGKSGAGLITVFARSNLADVNKSLGRMPELMDKFSGAMERADTMLGRLPNKADQFFVGFTSGIIGHILPSLERINDFDFTTAGENLGSALAQGLEMIENGTAWELFALHAEKAIETIRQGLVGGLASDLNIMWDILTGQSGRSGADYYNAGMDATLEKISALEERMAAIRAQAAAGFEAKRSAAAAVGGGGASAEVSPVVIAPTAAKVAPAAMPGVNDYQRRGLSLDGGPATAKMDKQTSLLTEIRDSMKRIADKGGVFAWP